MKKKIIIAVVLLGLIGGSGAAYIYFMPHRDVQSVKADEIIDAKTLVDKFLANPTEANKSYLSQDGESKVLIVSGVVAVIEVDGLGQQVLLLKNEGEKMGVNCTFTVETANTLTGVTVGSSVKIKGVIRSGAEYDEDLDLAEDAIMEKCAIVQ